MPSRTESMTTDSSPDFGINALPLRERPPSMKTRLNCVEK
jgi:hypothetical protein